MTAEEFTSVATKIFGELADVRPTTSNRHDLRAPVLVGVIEVEPDYGWVTLENLQTLSQQCGADPRKIFVMSEARTEAIDDDNRDHVNLCACEHCLTHIVCIRVDFR